LPVGAASPASGAASLGIIREDIIKIQHKMKSTREKWRGTKYDFYLLAHEHLYVFRKPATGEKMSEFKNSVKWR
jgi:hypothetical protein